MEAEKCNILPSSLCFVFLSGPASLVCAETLRQEGYTGRVVLVSQESSLPYDRIKLSKVGVKRQFSGCELLTL